MTQATNNKQAAPNKQAVPNRHAGTPPHAISPTHTPKPKGYVAYKPVIENDNKDKKRLFLFDFWDWFLIVLCILTLIFIFTSCQSPRLPAPSVEVREFVTEKIVRDTISIPLPSERIYVVSEDSSVLETKVAKSTAKILADGRLEHTLQNKSVIPNIPVEHKETIIRKDSIIHEPYAVPGETVYVKQMAWYQKIFFWIGIVTFFYFGVTGFLKIRKLF